MQQSPGLLSKNKSTMLRKGEEPLPGDLVTPEEQFKDPLVLEFLDLKDEYSEHAFGSVGRQPN